MERNNRAVLSDRIIYGADDDSTKVIRLDDICRMQSSEDIIASGQEVRRPKQMYIRLKDGSMSRMRVDDMTDWLRLISGIRKAEPDFFVSSFNGDLDSAEDFAYCSWDRVSNIWKITYDKTPEYPDVSLAVHIVTWFDYPNAPYESMKFHSVTFLLYCRSMFRMVERLVARAWEESRMLRKEDSCTPEFIRDMEKLTEEGRKECDRKRLALS